MNFVGDLLHLFHKIALKIIQKEVWHCAIKDAINIYLKKNGNIYILKKTGQMYAMSNVQKMK